MIWMPVLTTTSKLKDCMHDEQPFSRYIILFKTENIQKTIRRKCIPVIFLLIPIIFFFQSKKILLFLGLNCICTFILLLWCHTTNSMGKCNKYIHLTIVMYSCITKKLSLVMLPFIIDMPSKNPDLN